MPDTGTLANVRFAPRRLTHANIFVGDLETAVKFYTRVGGVEEVRREPGIGAAFMTNGSTHHDLGLMQCGGGKRVGLGGHVQVSSGRGAQPGLNHIGWEVDNEAVLVAALQRAADAGVDVHRTADHQLSHSVYIFDPDGHLHEFYADTIKDWRDIFNPTREDLITSHWDPKARPPMEARYWDPSPTIKEVPGAVFHPRCIARSAIVAKNFEAMKSFFVGIAGLKPVETGAKSALLLRAAAGADAFDLALFDAGNGLEPGIHHFSFDVPSEAKLASAEQRLRSAGVEIELIVDRPHKRSIFVRDPDGLRLEYRAARKGNLGDISKEAPALRPYLV